MLSRLSLSKLLDESAAMLAAEKYIGHYLMSYYNEHRPHSYNDGLSPVAAEKELNLLSGNA